MVFCIYFSGRGDSVSITPTSLPGISASTDIGSQDSLSISHSTVMILSDSTNLSDEEPEEVITFDTQPNEGRMPNSSYSAEDTLFTWGDITGELTRQSKTSLINLPIIFREFVYNTVQPVLY